MRIVMLTAATTTMMKMTIVMMKTVHSFIPTLLQTSSRLGEYLADTLTRDSHKQRGTIHISQADSTSSTERPLHMQQASYAVTNVALTEM